MSTDFISTDNNSKNNILQIKYNEANNHNLTNSIGDNSNQFQNLFSLDVTKNFNNINHKLRNTDILTTFNQTSVKLPTEKVVKDNITFIEATQNTPLLYIQEATPSIVTLTGRNYITTTNPPDILITNDDMTNLCYGFDSDNILYISPIAVVKESAYSFYKIDISLNVKFDATGASPLDRYFKLYLEKNTTDTNGKRLLFSDFKFIGSIYPSPNNLNNLEFFRNFDIMQMNDVDDKICLRVETDLEGFSIENLNISFSYIAPYDFTKTPNIF